MILYHSVTGPLSAYAYRAPQQMARLLGTKIQDTLTIVSTIYQFDPDSGKSLDFTIQNTIKLRSLWNCQHFKETNEHTDMKLRPTCIWESVSKVNRFDASSIGVAASGRKGPLVIYMFYVYYFI